MNVIIFGASGMVGSGVLIECLDDPRIVSVVVVGRSSCGVSHPKLKEIIQADLFDCSAIRNELEDFKACFYCLGVSAGGMDEATYSRLTYDLTMSVAEMLLASNPEMVFCYVSGAGTDSSGKGRMMWARVKGKTENQLLQMGFKAAYMFRPGYIQPVKGVRSKTKWYQAIYSLLGPLYPVLKRLFPDSVTTTERIGRAMIEVATRGTDQQIIEAPEINRLAESSRTN